MLESKLTDRRSGVSTNGGSQLAWARSHLTVALEFVLLTCYLSVCHLASPVGEVYDPAIWLTCPPGPLDRL